MPKIKLTSEMLRRIEDALDERKGDRRTVPQPAEAERRRRPDRRAGARAAGAAAEAPADPLTAGKSAPG